MANRDHRCKGFSYKPHGKGAEGSTRTWCELTLLLACADRLMEQAFLVQDGKSSYCQLWLFVLETSLTPKDLPTEQKICLL